MGGMEGNGLRQAIHITLRGRYNITYSGTLILHGNVTSRLAPAGNDGVAYNSTQGDEDTYDATGASYYVIAVVIVYGMSIVALIASHIKRRHDKISEDKQIDKYLHDFQIIKEVHARDQYKNLKKSVMHKINWDRKKGTHRTLQKSILPLLAIGMQVGASRQTSMELIQQQEGHHKGKRKVYPEGRKRHSDPDISDIAKLIEVNDPRPLRGRRHSCTPYFDQGQLPSLDLLTIPDTCQYSLAVPNTGGGNLLGGRLNPDTASARRLRFSSSASAMSVLDRSLNSISEREEDEAKDITPPRRRPSSAGSSRENSLPTPHSSLELPAFCAINTTPPISKAAKLRRIGISLTPPPDLFPEDAEGSSPVPDGTSGVHEDGDEVISVVVDDVWTRDDATAAGDVHVPAYNDSFTSEDGDDAISGPATPLYTSYPVSIMVEADDEDDDIDREDRGSPEWQPEMLDPEEPIRQPLSRRGSSIRDEEEEYRLTPQILLASLKFTGDTLTPNGSPRRSRSSSITSIMSRRGSKDRRRSAGSGGRDCDGMIEVTEDNPLQITCL